MRGCASNSGPLLGGTQEHLWRSVGRARLRFAAPNNIFKVRRLKRITSSSPGVYWQEVEDPTLGAELSSRRYRDGVSISTLFPTPPKNSKCGGVRLRRERKVGLPGLAV